MLVSARDVTFDVDAIVFDKDGTLIDVDVTWFGVGQTWIEIIARGDPDCTEALQSALGVGLTGLVPGGVLATGTLHEIELVTRSVVDPLTASDIEAAKSRVREAARTAPIVPLGDVAGTMQELAKCGIVLAVASSDDRYMIDLHLDRLGVSDFVTAIASGDADYPPKPDPASLEYVSSVCEVPTSRMLMVGDSHTDLGAARSAAMLGFVAIARTPEESEIADGSDAVLSSIDEILVEARR